jgi:serine/threonine-protein kinase RsbW
VLMTRRVALRPVAGGLSVHPAAAGAEGSLSGCSQVRVVVAGGVLSEVAEPVHAAVMLALAEEPNAVVCDLSAVHGNVDAAAVTLLASVGSQVRDWAGTPVAVVVPAGGLRSGLERQPEAGHLLFGSSWLQVIAPLRLLPEPAVVRCAFPPATGSVRAARDLVARAMLDWGCGSRVGVACLLVADLVASALRHAVADIEVGVARSGGQLRLAVRDCTATATSHQPVARAHVSGRGMLLVGALSQSWGVLPTAGQGRVVWAVLAADGDAAPDRSAGCPDTPTSAAVALR